MSVEILQVWGFTMTQLDYVNAYYQLIFASAMKTITVFLRSVVSCLFKKISGYSAWIAESKVKHVQALLLNIFAFTGAANILLEAIC